MNSYSKRQAGCTWPWLQALMALILGAMLLAAGPARAATEPTNKAGEMAGRRYVHEFNPASGGSRGWHETVDHAGTVRQVRPELNNGTKTHYRFDSNGNYAGSW